MTDKNFNDFLNSKGTNPPKQVSENILQYVSNDLNPSHLKVLMKLIAVQGFIGTVTLLFCPQFNLSLTNNYDVFHFFHRTFGHYGCMAVCGAIFVGSGALFASYILKVSELRKIRESKYLHLVTVTGISITLFLLIGAEVYVETSIFWSIGALTSGITMIEINKFLRLKVLKFYS